MTTGNLNARGFIFVCSIKQKYISRVRFEPNSLTNGQGAEVVDKGGGQDLIHNRRKWGQAI